MENEKEIKKVKLILRNEKIIELKTRKKFYYDAINSLLTSLNKDDILVITPEDKNVKKETFINTKDIQIIEAMDWYNEEFEYIEEFGIAHFKRTSPE